MIHSQEIALRNAAAMNLNLLIHKHPEERREDYKRRFELNDWARIDHFLKAAFLDQLDRCADDEARRILLGVSR